MDCGSAGPVAVSRCGCCLVPPVPLPGFTCPGDVVVTDHKHASHAPASEPEPEMTHLYLAELNSRGREVAPCLNGPSLMFYQVRVMCVGGEGGNAARQQGCGVTEQCACFETSTNFAGLVQQTASIGVGILLAVA